MEDKVQLLHELHKQYDMRSAMHQKRVAELAYKITEKISASDELLNNIYNAGLLHDIGKIFVPKTVLKSNNELSQREIDILRDHSRIGADFLERRGFNKFIINGAREHHERLNGEGYPEGLKENSISIEGRIIAICDVYDAMTSSRPYRKQPYNKMETIKKMSNSKKNIFDKHLLQILKQVIWEDKKEKAKEFLSYA